MKRFYCSDAGLFEGLITGVDRELLVDKVQGIRPAFFYVLVLRFDFRPMSPLNARTYYDNYDGTDNGEGRRDLGLRRYLPLKFLKQPAQR